MNLVKYESIDQIEAAKSLGSLTYIDESRIGIWGWSFGGHMAAQCLLTGEEVFSMAIAVALLQIGDFMTQYILKDL